MERRRLGPTGLMASVIGFGCGSVGGLMTRGDPREQERTVARAIDLGISYFDTAAQYGEGKSEENLGRVLRTLRAKVHVATKVKVPDVSPAAIGTAITEALDASLKRLGRERVDLYQLHNVVMSMPKPGGLSPEVVLAEVVPAMQRLQTAGKVGHFGMTALGETDAMLRLVSARAFATAQMPLNLLNPSPAEAIDAAYPAQDYLRMLEPMTAAGMSGVGIRVMAGGAIGGGAGHPLARAGVGPMGSGSSFANDLRRAAAFDVLVSEGHAESVGQAAIRYVLARSEIATVLVGASDCTQLEDAVAAARQGPLSPAALQRIRQIQATFVGEPR